MEYENGSLWSDSTFNPFENQQQIATATAGLVDYLNLYLPAGPPRDNLVSILNDAIARADRGETKFAIADECVRRKKNLWDSAP